MWWRSVLTLLLGSGAAQLGPLLFGPVLTRLYGPEVFGVFHLASAIGANVAVVACARYEFALPMAADEAEARALRQLCLRILWAVSGVTLVGALAGALWIGLTWPLAVPALVASLGALSLWTLEATRAQRFSALAWGRVLQFWGCGAVQALLGLLQAGLWGLLLGPIVAAVAAAWVLAGGRPRRQPDAAAAVRPEQMREVAKRHRDFPLLNTPHAFLGAVQDTLSIVLITLVAGPAEAGIWALALRYLKAPATLAGGAVSQVLYPRLAAHVGPTVVARAEVRRLMGLLGLGGLLLGLAVAVGSSTVLPALLGQGWEATGAVGQALAVYVALHFVASPLGVVTLAWKAQAWALRVSMVGQLVFVLALGVGLRWGGHPVAAHAEVSSVQNVGALTTAAAAVSVAMAVYFAWFFWKLWHWPVEEARSMLSGGTGPRDNPPAHP